MKTMNAVTRSWQAALFACLAAQLLPAQAQQAEDGKFKEPVYRISSARPDAEKSSLDVKRHPLDVALNMARDGLQQINQKIDDYTCVLIKRERINGKLGNYEYIFTKVRNRRVVDGKLVQPFSVYMYFLKPSSVKGREVIYVEGQNNGKLCAHEGGTKGKFLPTVWLEPNSALAMRGQLYPITDVGIANLVLKLIERGEREKMNGSCEVTFTEKAQVNKRRCTRLEVKHPTPRPELEFHVAEVFIDDELNVPIRYVARGWPEKEGGEPPVLEEYTYINLQVNVGLTDKDFDTNNKDYNF